MERLRMTKGTRDMTRDTPVPRLPLILLVLALSTPPAMAQTLPWPTDPPRAAGTPAATAAPAPMTGAPVAAPPPMMGSPMAAPRPMPGPPSGAQQECVTKFTQLRSDVEKSREVLDKVAASSRSKSDKTAAREEVCKAITNYAAAEGKWTKFIVDNTARCGIPPEVGKQASAGHGKTQATRKSVCAAGPAGGGAPAAPSLSDALGTSRQPLRGDSSTTRGTFDTLSGSAIAR
jgi:hypothetical protein